MTIKIGEKSFTTRKPSNLDDKIAEITGCSSAEIGAQLRAGAFAGHVARALHPFLAPEAPTAQELAVLIEADDLTRIRTDVAKLYEADEPKAAQAPAA